MVTSLTAAARKHLEQELLKRFLHDCDECEKLNPPYYPRIFRQILTDVGPIETARRVVISQKLPDGFTILWELNRLDLTTEAKMLDGQFCPLFDRDLLIRARNRLHQYGYTNLACPCLDAGP
jgi:hypothetical protein